MELRAGHRGRRAWVVALLVVGVVGATSCSGAEWVPPPGDPQAGPPLPSRTRVEQISANTVVVTVMPSLPPPPLVASYPVPWVSLPLPEPTTSGPLRNIANGDEELLSNVVDKILKLEHDYRWCEHPPHETVKAVLMTARTPFYEGYGGSCGATVSSGAGFRERIRVIIVATSPITGDAGPVERRTPNWHTHQFRKHCDPFGGVAEEHEGPLYAHGYVYEYCQPNGLADLIFVRSSSSDPAPLSIEEHFQTGEAP